MQGLLMGGESGVEWADNYYTIEFDPFSRSKIGSLDFVYAYPIFKKLNLILNFLINSPDCLASNSPFSVNSTSSQPVKRFSRFHLL